MPATIETVELTSETLFVTWMNESYRPVTEPSELVLTGTLKVKLDLKFWGAIAAKMYMGTPVNVQLGPAKAQFYVESMHSNRWITVMLIAQQTKYISPGENDKAPAVVAVHTTAEPGEPTLSPKQDGPFLERKP